MALIECKFFAETLGLSTTMTVILPEATQSQIGMVNRSEGGKHKVLYLLHGYSDDHSIWQRRTSIERYAAPLGIAVIMPEVHHSFYADMVYGQNFWQFVSEELPKTCKHFFPISDAREDTFVAGLSMGGFGAFKLALNQPDRFAAAASLSGAVDMVWRKENDDGTRNDDFVRIFGEDGVIKGTRNDLIHVAGKLADSEASMPRLWQCCGTDDFLWDCNVRFRDFARERGIPLEWVEDEGYGHSWDYWDLRIQSVLQWMFGSQGN